MSLQLKVVTDSMAPLIEVGALLELTEKNRHLAPFDIILFKRHSRLVVHYVWRNQLEHNDTLITRSLKNIYMDEEPVQYDELLGTVGNFRFKSYLKIKIIFLCLLKRAM